MPFAEVDKDSFQRAPSSPRDAPAAHRRVHGNEAPRGMCAGTSAEVVKRPEAWRLRRDRRLFATRSGIFQRQYTKSAIEFRELVFAGRCGTYLPPDLNSGSGERPRALPRTSPMNEAPGFYGALRYIAVERFHCAREQATIAAKRHVRDASQLRAEFRRTSAGCFVSNELVDGCGAIAW